MRWQGCEGIRLCSPRPRPFPRVRQGLRRVEARRWDKDLRNALHTYSMLGDVTAAPCPRRPVASDRRWR